MKKIHRKDPNRSTEFCVENCELIIGGKQLCENTKLQFNYGHKYGIIGRNGIGKTQLFGAIARGDFDKMPKHLQILLVEQEIIGDETSVIQAVL
jgi:ATP-binding cassette subfamily F protein 3